MPILFGTAVAASLSLSLRERAGASSLPLPPGEGWGEGAPASSSDSGAPSPGLRPASPRGRGEMRRFATAKHVPRRTPLAGCAERTFGAGVRGARSRIARIDDRSSRRRPLDENVRTVPKGIGPGQVFFRESHTPRLSPRRSSASMRPAADVKTSASQPAARAAATWAGMSSQKNIRSGRTPACSAARA